MVRTWFERVRAELAVGNADPRAVPFLGNGRLARLWRSSTSFRSAAFLGLGSAWDAATLTRIDRWSDQALLATYQVGLAILVVLQLRHANRRRVPRFVADHPEGVHFAAQFLLGGLLSAFTIYYVRGAASPRSALFIGLLVALLVANEVAEKPLRMLWARLSLLAFCQFNGLLFILPLLTGSVVSAPYVAGLAVAATGLVLLAIHPRPAPTAPVFTDHLVAFARGLLPAAATLGVVLCLVWLQVLPPLPLSLHRVGVFHAVEHLPEGYALTWEREPIVGRLFWRYDHVFHRQPGESVTCFSSVFAPGGMTVPILHRWEHYGADGWETVDEMKLDVSGGRAEGFRTFSRKENVPAGSWRIRILLSSGRELGRVLFEVVDGPPEHPLVTEVF